MGLASSCSSMPRRWQEPASRRAIFLLALVEIVGLARPAQPIGAGLLQNGRVQADFWDGAAAGRGQRNSGPALRGFASAGKNSPLKASPAAAVEMICRQCRRERQPQHWCGVCINRGIKASRRAFHRRVFHRVRHTLGVLIPSDGSGKKKPRQPTPYSLGTPTPNLNLLGANRLRLGLRTGLGFA